MAQNDKPYISLNLVDDDGNIYDTIDMDVREASTYNYSSDVTNFPVDMNADITDFIRLLPYQIQLEGIVSDCSMEVNNSASSKPALKGNQNLSNSMPSKITSAFNKLLKCWKEKKLLVMLNEFEARNNLVIENLRITRQAGNGLALRFSMDLKQIRIVSPQIGIIPSDILLKLKKRKAKAKEKPPENSPEYDGAEAKRKKDEKAAKEKNKGEANQSKATGKTAGKAKVIIS